MKNKEKYNLHFVSFIIYAHIDSKVEMINLELTLKFLFQNFYADIHVIEIGLFKKIPADLISDKIKFHYFQDYCYKYFYLNEIIKVIKTPIITFWQNGVITNPQNIYNAAIKVKENPHKCFVSYPEQILNVPKPILNLYRNNSEQFKFITENEKKLIPVFCKLSNIGFFLINKNIYKYAGFENPTISNFKNTCFERQKRLEILGIKMENFEHSLYSFSNLHNHNHVQLNNEDDLREIQKINCMTSKELKEYILSWHTDDNLNDQLIEWQYNNLKSQKETLKDLYSLLTPNYPFMFDFSWSTFPDFLKIVISKIQKGKPMTIVECGSGVSTIVCGYALKKNNMGHIFSLEHNKMFYDISKNEIVRQKLENFITLIYAPLKKVKIGEKEWVWYNIPKIEKKIGKINILIVDGPPGYLQKYSRYPAVPVLKKFFAKNTTIILDDSKRPDEQVIINRWMTENCKFNIEYIKTIKGMCVISQK